MQAEEIESYLAQFGQELADCGVEQPVRVLVIGGAFMLLQVHNRLTTDDVDVFFKDIEDTTISPHSTSSAELLCEPLPAGMVSRATGSTI